MLLAGAWRCCFCGTAVFAGALDAGLVVTFVAGCVAEVASAFFVVFFVVEELLWVALVAVLVALVLREALLAGLFFFGVSLGWVCSAAQREAGGTAKEIERNRTRKHKVVYRRIAAGKGLG